MWHWWTFKQVRECSSSPPLFTFLRANQYDHNRLSKLATSEVLALKGVREHCLIQGRHLTLHHLHDCHCLHPQRRRNTAIFINFESVDCCSRGIFWVSIINFEICIWIVYRWLSKREHLSQLLTATRPWWQIYRIDIIVNGLHNRSFTGDYWTSQRVQRFVFWGADEMRSEAE